jgi:hypothetical protein
LCLFNLERGVVEKAQNTNIKVSIYDKKSLREHAEMGALFAYDVQQEQILEDYRMAHSNHLLVLKEQANPWRDFFNTLLCRITDENLQRIKLIKNRQATINKCARKGIKLREAARYWELEAIEHRVTRLAQLPEYLSTPVAMQKVVIQFPVNKRGCD